MTSDSEASAGAERTLWQRLDQRIYRLERAVVVAFTLVMVVLVFLAVFWGLFVPTPQSLGPIQSTSFWSLLFGPAGATALWLLVCWFGVRTAKPDWTLGKQVLWGFALGLGTVGAGRGFVWLFPSGLVFSQKVALGLMMWMVFLGSSVAAYKRRHIVVQAAQRLVPEESLPYHAALSLGVAALFTFFLAYVGLQYTWENFHDWWGSARLAGIFEPSLNIPNWVVSISVPIGLGMTAVRFVAQAIAIARGELEPVPAQEEVLAAQQSAGEEKAVAP